MNDTKYIRDNIDSHEDCMVGEDLQADTFVGCANAASEARELF